MVDTIQHRIKTLIDSSGFQQNEIAEFVGVTPQAITKWLNSGKINKKNLSTLCKMTNARMEWVLEGKGQMLDYQIKETSPNGYSNEVIRLAEQIKKMPEQQRAQLTKIIEALGIELKIQNN